MRGILQKKKKENEKTCVGLITGIVNTQAHLIYQQDGDYIFYAPKLKLIKLIVEEYTFCKTHSYKVVLTIVVDNCVFNIYVENMRHKTI